MYFNSNKLYSDSNCVVIVIVDLMSSIQTLTSYNIIVFLVNFKTTNEL